MPETAEKVDVAEEVDAKPDQETITPANVEQNRCVVLAAYGGSKHVHVEKRDQRTAGRGEIAVDVEACGINFLDVMMRQGLLDAMIKPPFVMGSECSGLISQVGEGVTNYKVGDPVVVISEHGAWTEHLVVPVAGEGSTNELEATSTSKTTTAVSSTPASPPNSPQPAVIPLAVILPRPKSLTPAKAAVMALAYLPAYILLHHVACVRKKDVVLVHSAGGGVGSAIGQLAKLIPGVKLIGTASKDKHERLSAYYDQLISTDQDYVAEIKKLHPHGISIVLDCLCGEDTNKAYSVLQPLGKYILYGTSSMVTGDRKSFFNMAKTWFHVDRINPVRLHEENRTLGGFALKSLLFNRRLNAASQSNQLIHEVWTELTTLVDSKRIDPWIDSEWSMEEVKDAMLRLQDRKNIGKVVLNPKLQPPKVEAKEEMKSKEETESAGTSSLPSAS